MYSRLDEAVLARTERASHRIQLRTGLGCFALARLCHLLTYAIAAATASSLPVPIFPVAGVIASFATMFCVMMWQWYAQMETHYATAPEVAHPNTLQWRISQFASRMMMLHGIPCAVAYGIWRLDAPERVAIAFGIALCAWAAGLYLHCCIPLPPGAHRDWLAQRERRRAEAAAHALGQHSPV
jgi:hypothetical protein